MASATTSLETLKSQNYSRQSELTAKNKKTLEKMFQYIHTFSLNEYQIECIHQDLIGMAQEAELRQESFSEILGKSPLSFCDDLILASGQISIPAGRRILRSAGWYYCIAGGIFALVGGMNIIGLILGASGSCIWQPDSAPDDIVPTALKPDPLSAWDFSFFCCKFSPCFPAIFCKHWALLQPSEACSHLPKSFFRF